jgi:hypothetical protein
VSVDPTPTTARHPKPRPTSGHPASTQATAAPVPPVAVRLDLGNRVAEPLLRTLAKSLPAYSSLLVHKALSPATQKRKPNKQ